MNTSFISTILLFLIIPTLSWTQGTHEGNGFSAEGMLHDLEANLESASLSSDSIRLYAEIGFLHKMLGNYQEALKFNSTSLVMAESESDLLAQSIAHEHLSAIYYSLGDLVKSMHHARSDLYISMELDTVSLAIAYYQLGIAQLDHGLLTSAFDTLQIARSIYEEEGHIRNVAACYGLLSVILSQLGKDEEGLRLQTECINALRSLPRSRALVQALCANADRYRLTGRYEEAFPLLEEAGSYAREHGFLIENILVTQRYGELLLDMGQFKASSDSLLTAQKLMTENHQEKLLVRNQEFLSRAFEEQGLIDRALKEAEIGLPYLNIAGKPEDPELLILQISHLYSLKGDFETAYTKRLEYDVLVEKRTSQEQLTQVRELEARFKNEEQKVTLLEQARTMDRQEADLLANESRMQIFMLALIAAILVSFITFFWYRSRIRNQQQQSKIELNQALIESTEDERERIARELHDGTGSLLTGIKLGLDKVKDISTDEETRERLGTAIKQVQEISKEVRRVSHAMAPTAIDRLGFQDVLTDLVTTFSQIGSAEIDFSAAGDLEHLSKTERLMLYRILQECLNNSFKHSEATEIHISISAIENEVELLFQDNGKGYDPQNAQGGLGLGSIEKRIEYLNGKRTLETDSGKGMLLIINFPTLSR